ncbi:hypothetical protein GGI43DRAFT_427041 [Trichoderma evansii]
MRTTDLEIDIEVGSDIDLGWISSTRVSLLYDGTLIGEAELKGSYIIPDEFNMIKLELDDIEIRNMIGFKAFIRRVIPHPRDGSQLEGKTPVALLKTVENGHTLAMVINLDRMGVAEALHPPVRRNHDKIQITFFVRNPTNVFIYFEETRFNLQKDGRILATLEGEFFIRNCGEDDEYVLTGDIDPNIELFGTAVLKGVGLDVKANTWCIHAIREFELEIDLDEIIHGEL